MFQASYFKVLQYFVLFAIPERRIWSILLIKSDFKWCIHLRRILFFCIILKLESGIIMLVFEIFYFRSIFKLNPDDCLKRIIFLQVDMDTDTSEPVRHTAPSVTVVIDRHNPVRHTEPTMKTEHIEPTRGTSAKIDRNAPFRHTVPAVAGDHQ